MWKKEKRYHALRMDEDGARGSVSRRQLLGYAAVGAAGAAAASLAGGQGATASPAYLRGMGDFRRLDLFSRRTGERLNIVFYADGEYIPEALDEINFIARDWRRNEIRSIDVKAVDFAAALHNRLETSESLHLVSGYRSLETNNLLRRRGRGVAKNSYHTKAMALDVTLESRTVSQMYRAAMVLKAGGVGRYSRDHFVHVDSGPVRSWGR
jgi:uncharacterized protein YcbK (DUF882 family)